MPVVGSKISIRRVLVLGAYGLIGSAVVRRLQQDGFAVAGLGRNARTARIVLPDLEWIICDLADLLDVQTWRPVLDQFDAVVNCAGALQDGGSDDLTVVHERAVAALAEACHASDVALVQISAVGAHPDASTNFMRSKWAGDEAIRQAGIRHWIFKPGLVLGPTAYGGTTLLRMLAAIPLIQPIAYPEVRIQTVSLADLAQTVSLALSGQIPVGMDCDLVEDQPHSLRDIVGLMRAWIGFSPARRELVMPQWAILPISRCADALGRLGWRSPLRTSAIRVLSEGVIGTPKDFKKLGVLKLSAMDETFASMPASAEDRTTARLALIQPIIVAVLFFFWFASGLVGIWKLGDAGNVLTEVGWPPALAVPVVLFWSIVDIAIALLLLVRKFSAQACSAMVIVSLLYLLSATIFTPFLWADPLGPLLKVMPGIALALVARIGLEVR